MSYSYETRGEDIYLLTGHKNKDKNIVIKLGATLQETTVTDALTRTSYSLVWKLEKGEKDEELNINGYIDGSTYNIKVDTKEIVTQLVNVVNSNLTLEGCPLIINSINNTYNEVFNDFLNSKGVLLCSNNIVNGYIVVRNKGKILGTASRFIYNALNDLKICEYVGKTINAEMNLETSLIVGDSLVKFRRRGQFTTSNNNASDELIYDPDIETLGYFGYEAGIYNITDDSIEVSNEEAPEIFKIKVPQYFTTSEEMNNYCKENNSIEDIERYRISLKPKVQLIDINKFMLREFTI